MRRSLQLSSIKHEVTESGQIFIDQWRIMKEQSASLAIAFVGVINTESQINLSLLEVEWTDY
jgi:hypothetical protein